MTRPLDVAVLNGSLRRASTGARLSTALGALMPERFAFSAVPIGELALYNQDLEENPPEPWRAFRKRIAACEALVFVTSESNRSIPAPLKNAIDVGSRPYGQAAWKGKPALVVSHSPGPLGGFGANHHLRQSLAGIDVAVMPAPETYLSHSTTLVGEDGTFIPETREFLAGVMAAFSRWVEHNPAR